MTVAQTANVFTLLEAGAEAACTRYPQDTARIRRGLTLAQLGHVERQAKGQYTVRSQQYPDTAYAVLSNGTTVCSCEDYHRHAPLLCKHCYAVLLVRWAVRQWQAIPPPEPEPAPKPSKAFYAHVYEEAGILIQGADGRIYFLNDANNLTVFTPEMATFTVVLGEVGISDTQHAVDLVRRQELCGVA